jgi:hypothetical protein
LTLTNKEDLLQIYNSPINQIPDKVNTVTAALENLNIELHVKLMMVNYEKIANQNLNDFKTASRDKLLAYINLLKSKVK